MRGFYRAVKRKEKWALSIWDKKDSDPLGYFLSLTYRSENISKFIYSENTFLAIFKKK